MESHFSESHIVDERGMRTMPNGFPDISNEVGRVKFVLVSFLFTVRTLVRERGALVSLE